MKLSIGSLLLSIGLMLGVPATALGVPTILKHIEDSQTVTLDLAVTRAAILEEDKKIQDATDGTTEDKEKAEIDLSGVNWADLALLIAEEQRITRQMEVDEARMLYGKCGEWRPLALAVGWPAEEWPTLSYVLHRESRCNIGSWNKTDPATGSRGLMQINGYWCRPSKWSKAGWLQDRGILSTCEDLFSPEINLRAGLAIWQYGEEKHGCGWRGPWATRCS